jgi:hypothetical protein
MCSVVASCAGYSGGLPPVSIEFGSVEWGEEVERYDRRSPARAQAQSARRNMIAFGERHPADERTRNVYERAHKRLHGRYP